jgi:hypothetical protein
VSAFGRSQLLIHSGFLVSRFRPFALSRLSYAEVPKSFARERWSRFSQVEKSSPGSGKLIAKARKREKDK